MKCIHIRCIILCLGVLAVCRIETSASTTPSEEQSNYGSNDRSLPNNYLSILGFSVEKGDSFDTIKKILGPASFFTMGTEKTALCYVSSDPSDRTQVIFSSDFGQRDYITSFEVITRGMIPDASNRHCSISTSISKNIETPSHLHLNTSAAILMKKLGKPTLFGSDFMKWDLYKNGHSSLEVRTANGEIHSFSVYHETETN